MWLWRHRTVSSARSYGTNTDTTRSLSDAMMSLCQRILCISQARSLLRGEWSTTDTRHSSPHPLTERDRSQNFVPSDPLCTRGPFWINGNAPGMSRRETRVILSEAKSPTWISTGSPSANTCWLRNCAPIRGWRLARSAPMDASGIGRLAPFTILGSELQTGYSLWTKSSACAPTASLPAFASVYPRQ